MAKIKVVKKEVTIIAEQRGHGLFLWHRHPERHGRFFEFMPPTYETLCARCGEPFRVEGEPSPYIAGPVNAACERKAAC
jgi:hypothetical protein